MQLEELNVEGIGVNVRPEWHKKIAREVAHIEAHHPGAFTRISVRLRPVHPHRPGGMSIKLDGRIDQHPFNIERDGENVITLIHEVFAIARRTLEERTDRGHSREELPVPDLEGEEDATEEASQTDQGANP